MATTNNNPANQTPHIVLFPCTGMGHLIPFLRLASMFESCGFIVTIVSVNPTVSSSESDQLSIYLSTHPNIKPLKFQLLPQTKKNDNNNEDPFFGQMEVINSSVHLLQPLLSSLTLPVSAIFADFIIAPSATDLASKLSIDAYVVVTTSATFLSLMTCVPQRANIDHAYIEIPCLGRMYFSNVPPPMLDPNTIFSATIGSSVSSFFRAKGVLINTFKWFESQTIEALSSSKVATPLVAPVFPIGPFESFETKPETHHIIPWLERQEPESVLFVSFGSRTALSIDQIRELGLGLELSGCKFVWVLKASKVDKDDKEGVEDILGELFLARTQERGSTIVKGWVNQERILAHPCIGGFISHCGWNSVTEAAKFGVPILAWPQHGDQRVNAEIVENPGLGLWVKRMGLVW